MIGADVALFYYAGHGIQIRGSNYLVPVSANPAKEADVDFQMVDVALVLRQMEGSGTRLKLVILDACRNNPFGGRGLRSTTSGLAQIQAPEGTLLSYATQPGNVALDGGGDNSPFTSALVQTIQKPGIDVFQTFNQVGLMVKRATGGSQQPWVSSSPIDGDFYFTEECRGGSIEAGTGAGARGHAGTATIASAGRSNAANLTRAAVFAGAARHRVRDRGHEQVAGHGGRLPQSCTAKSRRADRLLRQTHLSR